MTNCHHIDALLDEDERDGFVGEPRHAAERLKPPLKLLLTSMQTSGFTTAIHCDEHGDEINWGFGAKPEASNALRVAAGMRPARRWWEWLSF